MDDVSQGLLNKTELGTKGDIDKEDKYIQTQSYPACKSGNTKTVVEIQNVTVCLPSSRRNSLDNAITNGEASCARIIIESDNWRESLRNSNENNDTTMRRLIRKMPEIAGKVMTRCVEQKSGNVDNDSENDEVEFDYEFLDDELFIKNWKSKNNENNECAKAEAGEDRVVNDKVPYSDDLTLLMKNHPLNIMIEARQLKLLRHPLVVSYLDYKWKRFVRPVYYLNMSLYLMFMVFFNLYMLTMPPPYLIDLSNVTSSCVAIIIEAQSTFGRCYDYKSSGIVSKYFVIVLSAICLLKKSYEVYAQRISYFQSFKNLFEVSLYILAILTVYSDTNSAGPNYYGVREDWQWQIGAVSIFLSWMVLIMFIRNVPTFGI